ncbi:MAG: hypothetical protein V3V16_03160 [Melioribacteraceae bacterium]
MIKTIHKAINTPLKVIIPIVIIIVVVIILWKLTKNVKDLEWIELKNLNLSEVVTLENSNELLNQLFEEFHERKNVEKDFPISLINKPYVPIMEYRKFEKYIKALKKENRIVVSTVEGGGSTTLVDRLARFIAEDEKRIMNTMCSPQFDLIYHKRFIGEEKNGKYIKGKLLLFWEECVKNPNEKFVAIFDDFDKINPETLFGPNLWENIANPKYKMFVEGYEVIIPNNFYMISTTESAVGSRILLHNEHFKRIGKNYYLRPNTVDLALYLDRNRTKLETKKEKQQLSEEENTQLSALSSSTNIFQYLYLFQKINQQIEKDVSKSSQLAQWSNLRKLYLPEEREELIETFISHVNAISPEKPFDKRNLESIFYTLENDGLLKGSSPLAVGFKVFKEWGFLTEFVVAICFALSTALFSVYVNSKRKKKVTKFLTRSEEIYLGFESREIDTETAIAKLAELKLEIEEHTKNNKISFPEAVFFYNTIRSKVNHIEISKNVNSTFLTLLDVFMDDDLLSKNEYDKLLTFLHKIEHSIPKNDFERMKKEVNQAWEDFGEK